MKWGPTKPKTRIKVIECGAGQWDEKEHGLDFPGPSDTLNSKGHTGTGQWKFRN